MKKFPLWATLFMLFGVAILCALGVWQLQRLEWKRGLLAELENEYQRVAIDINLKPEILKTDFEFKRGMLTGIYLYDKEIFIGPRTYEHVPGKHVLTPFQLEEGTILLVNRGWVPQQWTAIDEKSARPEGATVQITGLLRKPARGNPFAPENNVSKDEWYMINMPQIAKARGITRLSPYVFYLENLTGISDYPLPADEKPDFTNNHLQYAFFWFSMAGILVVIYLLRFVRKA